MTTPSTERKAGPLLGTGAQTAWPFTFKVFAATDIAVTIANNLGVETALVYGVDYNVTLNANQETSPGGTVTYPISGTPLPTGSRLVIVGNLPYDQPLDLPAGGNFSPLALENQLDRTVMQIQQLAEKTGRALQVSITTDADVTLPPPAASQLIGWDSTGENLQNVPLTDIGTAIAYGAYRYDTFTGDGATTNFALSQDPAALANLDVSISGVVQVPGTDYSLVNGNLVFGSAPANGTIILARYGQALPSIPDSDQVSFVQAGAGAVTRTVQNKLREMVTPEDFGAVGDGVANDTAAMIATINYVNSVSSVSQLRIKGTYLIDFLAIGPNNRFDITRDDLTIAGGGTIKVKPNTYGAGVANGAYKFYTCFHCTGNRVTVEGITFDGNNQFSQYLSSPSLPNYWWNAVYFTGTSTAVRTNNGRVVNCRYINGGGWPFRGQFHDYGLINGCYVEHSQGCGFDSGSLCVVSNNISYNAHDAHFATWNSLGATIVGNTCDTNDNGSGIDVSGSKDCTVVGNTIRACANRGIWVVADPNTNNPCLNVTISGNTFFNNNSYTPISEKGDIQVGTVDVTTDSRPIGTVDCNGLTITGNTFYTYNGANSITLGKYTSNVLIEANTFADQPASAANRALTIWYAQNVIYRNNQDLIGRRQGAGSYPKALGSGPVWFDGVDTTFDSSVAVASLTSAPVRKSYFKETSRRQNAGKNYQIDERFGYSEFGAEFNSVNGSVDIADIGFTSGGFEVADIELIVTVGGNRGVRRTRVVYQGYNSATPTQIVAAADEYSGGGAAPTITFTASTGNVRVSVGSNATLSASVWMRVGGTAGTVPNITALI